METNSTMASTIRNNAKWPVVITSILMAITIGSYGISEIISNKNQSSDIYLKNWKTYIKLKELREISNQEISMLDQFRYQYQMSDEQARGILDRIILQTAIQLKDAERKNITVTEKEITEKISQDKRFADEKGNFDPKKYDEALNYLYRNYKETEERRVIFEKKIGNDILKDKLRLEVIKDVKPNEQEIKDEFHNKFDNLEYEYVTFNVDAKKAPEPTAEEIKKNYESNSKSPEFMSDKKIKVKYIFFPYNKYAVEPPKPEEAQAYYDKNKAEFLEKEPAVDPADKTEKPTDKPKEPKYLPFKTVEKEIIHKLTDIKVKAKASEVTDKIHTEMSKIKNDKNEVDILKAYETLKPENGIQGESTYFSKTNGADELIEKFGDVKTFRQQAFATLGKLTLQRSNFDKGIMFYFAYKSDIKEPTLKSLEECKPMIVEELKEEKSWQIAEKSAKDLEKLCETDGWVKTLEAQKITPVNQKVVISEAAAKHTSIVSTLLEKKISTGKYLVLRSKENLPEKEFYLVFYKERTPASDEKFKKEKNSISATLDSSKKSKAWGEYTSKLGKDAGLPEEEKEKE